jgi:hypothetical protein
MKVRIKKTGEILEVAEYAKVAMDVCDSYGCPLEYGLDEIEIIGERRIFESYSVVNWQQVKIQAAMRAMQGMIANSNEIDYRGMSLDKINSDAMAELAVNYAHSLVEELKKDVNV